MKKAVLIAVFSLLLQGSCLAGAPERCSLTVVKEYPHDESAYTQGLFFHDGSLFESTGLHGKSTLRKVDPESGKVLRKLSFSPQYFVEGSVVLGGRIFILTWQNRVVFEYDAATLKYIRTRSYTREGWGLTTDGVSLIASDGSSNIYFLSPELKVEKTVEVKLGGRPLRLLNELEWIDGRIWANVYTTDTIVVINPSNGEVEKTIDCRGLLPDSLRGPETDVLNGIAAGPDGKIYLTGKNWPKMYEVRIVKNDK